MQYFIELADLSLARLVSTLAKSRNHMFKHTNMYFNNPRKNPNNRTDLLLQKDVYCYDYMDSFEKFNESQLPAIDKFYSSLSEG